MQIPYSEYDRFLDIFSRIPNTAEDYVPDEEQLNLIEKEFQEGTAQKYLPFLLWIEDTGVDTSDNVGRRKRLSQILKTYVEIGPDEELETSVFPKEEMDRQADEILDEIADLFEKEGGIGL